MVMEVHMPDTGRVNRTAPAWMYEQSAVIAYRFDGGELRIAMITSASGRRWVIPKGVIDPGETGSESAEREALEEAGLIGDVSNERIGRYTYEKWGGVCTVDVYLMAVEHARDEWAESDMRTREWISPEEAAHRAREPELKRMLLDLPARLGRDEN
jgi:phosphohistidine phosphatase